MACYPIHIHRVTETASQHTSIMIPLSVPSIKGNEWTYIKQCLDSEWVSSAGQYVDRFESEVSKFTGSRYAIACVNGTSALQVALRLVGVESNDEVIVPTLTFIAPVNAIRYLSAFPVFMDCDDYYNIDVDKTLEFIEKQTSFVDGYTRNKTTDRRISAIIPVHVFGNAVAADALVAKCKERNIKVVEDATESLGTFYKQGIFTGRHTGTIGSIGCLSFNGNKIITTGGGGMILTDNSAFAEMAKYLTTQAKDDEIRYIHNEVGYNFRLTNIQAAMGVAQMERLPDYLKNKKENFQKYKKGIETIPGLSLASSPPYADNNLWMYALRIEKDVYGKDREQLMAHLLQNGVQSRPIWQLNHVQKPYKSSQNYKIEKAFVLLEKTLNIPCSVSMSSDQIEFILRKLSDG